LKFDDVSLMFAVFFEITGIIIAIGMIFDTVKVVKYFGKGLPTILKKEYGEKALKGQSNLEKFI